MKVANNLFLIAGAISALLCLGHVFGGGTLYHAPAMVSDWDTEAKAVYSIVWNFVSVFLAINTIALFLGAQRSDFDNVCLLVALQYGAFALTFIIYGISRMGSLLILPQWAIFLAISMLIVIGYVRKYRLIQT